MKFEHLRAFEKHLEGATPSPLYFIIGKEAFECQEAIQLVLHSLLPSPQQREVALSIFDGAQTEEEEIGNALYSFSFFSKLRVIWIQQADKLKKSMQETLEKYFTKPTATHHLLLSASSWHKNTTFYKTAEKEGIILDLAELKPWEKEKRLIEWASAQLTQHHKLAPYPVCQQLVKSCGNDQALLKHEIDKLICYCGAKNEITSQDIKAICTKQNGETIWQLGEALFRRDASTAIQLINALLEDGEALLPLIRQIRGQFQTEYQIALLLAQGKRGEEISQEFPYLKGALLDRHLKQAKEYGLDAFKRGLLTLDETELKLKNSSTDEQLLAEILIHKLTR